MDNKTDNNTASYWGAVRDAKTILHADISREKPASLKFAQEKILKAILLLERENDRLHKELSVKSRVIIDGGAGDGKNI